MDTCHVCLDQILEPDPPTELVVLNDNGSAAIKEGGVFSIPQGADVVAIVFSVQKLSTLYTFTQLEVSNDIDLTPLDILATPGSKSQNGFTANLNGLPDTNNYRLLWAVEVTEV